MTLHLELKQEIAAIAALPPDKIELARAALVIARSEYPDLQESPYLDQLDRLADRLRLNIRSMPPSEPVLERMSALLCEEEGFRGNRSHYYDPRNSFLNEVMDRRLGIPITLSILFMEVGRRAGLPMHGIGFPGHFLVGLVTEKERIVLDPFHDGRILSMRDCRLLFESYGIRGQTFRWELLDPVLPNEILVRLMRNLKLIYVHTKQYSKALAIIEWILLFHPDSPMELRDRGLIYEAVDDPRLAVIDLERYLMLEPHAQDRAHIQAKINRLKQMRTPDH